MSSKFEDSGYLSSEAENLRQTIRAENKEWFELAEDLNKILVQAAHHATETAKSMNWSPEVVATRVVLRSCGTLQSAVLLVERGVTAESRILARSLIEDAFCIAALAAEPTKFLDMLKQDSEASRKLQGKFIEAQGMVEKGETRDKLIEAINDLGKPEIMSVKKLAGLGALTRQYLVYQRLSDDSAHTSARALEHHLSRSNDGSSWRYRWGAASKEENAKTLHAIVLGAIPIAIGITEILKDKTNGSALSSIVERFTAMPNVPII